MITKIQRQIADNEALVIRQLEEESRAVGMLQAILDRMNEKEDFDELEF